MKIPDSIRIAGVDYAIEWKSFFELDGRACYGLSDLEKSIISLEDSNRCGWQHKCQTFLHECLHCIAYHYGIQLAKKDEEEIIDKFATGIYQMLQDNGRKLFDLVEASNCVAGVRQDGKEE